MEGTFYLFTKYIMYNRVILSEHVLFISIIILTDLTFVSVTKNSRC